MTFWAGWKAPVLGRRRPALGPDPPTMTTASGRLPPVDSSHSCAEPKPTVLPTLSCLDGPLPRLTVRDHHARDEGGGARRRWSSGSCFLAVFGRRARRRWRGPARRFRSAESRTIHHSLKFENPVRSSCSVVPAGPGDAASGTVPPRTARPLDGSGTREDESRPNRSFSSFNEREISTSFAAETTGSLPARGTCSPYDGRS